MTTIGVKSAKKTKSLIGGRKTGKVKIKKERKEKTGDELFSEAVKSVFGERDDIIDKIFKFKINKVHYFSYDNMDELYEMYFLMKENEDTFDEYFNSKLDEIRTANELGIKMKASALIFDSPLLEEYRDVDIDITEVMRSRENIADTNWTCRNKKCGSRKIILGNVNNRSGDEGMTVTYNCSVCGENWMQKG